MDANSKRPKHQPETEFIGELQEFSGTFLPPDDPSLEPRERKGRPADRKPPADDESEDQRQAG